jgi:hypothetical protein
MSKRDRAEQTEQTEQTEQSVEIMELRWVPVMDFGTHFRSEILFLIPPSNGPRLDQLSGGDGNEEMYDLSNSGICSAVMLMPGQSVSDKTR